jgi:hypothetical protein
VTWPNVHAYIEAYLWSDGFGGGFQVRNLFRNWYIATIVTTASGKGNLQMIKKLHILF